MPSNGAQSTTTKRKSTRVKKNRWHEDTLTTNSDSPLVNIDLVKLLADQRSWSCLDEEDKKQILALLPESVHPPHEPNPDGADVPIPPPSQDFLRYSNAWRDGIRQVQTDLANGKYEPQWQRRANDASKERAEGKFDKWKEDEFEEFWGQKQKVNTTTRSGESAGVRLKTLVENGAVRVDDVWKYSCLRRVNGEKILVEKEVLVVNWDGSSLTFAIPPGQRVILSLSSKRMLEGQSTTALESPVQDVAAGTAEQILDTNLSEKPEESDQPTISEPGHAEQIECCEPPTAEHPSIEQPDIMQPSGLHELLSQLNDAAAGDDQGGLKDTEHESIASQRPPTAESDVVHMVGGTPRQNECHALNGAQVTDSDARSLDESAKPAIPDTLPPKKTEDETSNRDEDGMDVSDQAILHTPKADSDTTEQRIEQDIKPGLPTDISDTPIILSGVTGPASLARKIHEIDGRSDFNSKLSSWRNFRCLRMNQDMGSLWDLREGWYCRTNNK